MAPGSRSSSRLSQPLPMIIEDVVHSTTPPPGVPPKSPRRPPVSRSNSQGSSVRGSHRSRTPPPFGAVSGGVERPASGTAKMEVAQREVVGGGGRDQGPVARKGWYRKMFGVLLVVGVIVGLSAGLTIGLRKRNQTSQSDSPSPTNLFPSGSYIFTTALLTNTSTACLTFPSLATAWQCYTSPEQQPQPRLLATAIFHWTITPSPRSGYTISSNPSHTTGPQFQNLTLTHLDINQYNERFVFSLIYPKPVTLSIPTNGTEGGGEERIQCWFNTTVLSAAIYTRQRASWPEDLGGVILTEITGRAGKEGEERVWPFLVEVGEVQQGGEDGEGGVVPDCYRDGRGVDLGGLFGGNDNGTAGGIDGAEGECGCWYKNFELDGLRGNGTMVERLRRGR
ncbi:hypothetical protein QC762_102045 [Podospora pseudocomata]|uniref:Tat pathway signal sequence n=1 Tax=Podospora pseudocomata TaxID=2093779 RepID=A0ABR0GSA9_9PEZI|nr:hypothetical protein QC762_102045 [Podospora pseudocomata]